MTTITIELRPEEERHLQALAVEQRKGKDIAALLKDVIAVPVGKQGTERGLDEILAPYRLGFAESDMTEEEAEAFLNSELEAVRTERYAQRMINA